jgi:phosphoribosyl 1,2-cyclic phosphodiesterase
MADEMTVKFWGVRGSYPAPGAGTVKYGGNTPCVEIRVGERTIILDAGTGSIPLGRELARNRTTEIILLFSHLHHDHTQGFPFFVPAYVSNVRIHIFGPGGTPETLRRVLENNQSSETFPLSLRDMASSKDIQSVHESQVIVWDERGVRLAESTDGVGEDAILIRIHKSYAHPGGVYIYGVTWRGRSTVYATDTEGYVGTDRRLAQFAKGADVLIHDAQYLEAHYRGQLAGFPATQGFGHSTVTMACQVAVAAEAGQLVLFHHDPAYSDAVVAGMEATAKSQFANARAAYEGLEIALHPANKIAKKLQLPASHVRDVKYANHD